KMKTTLLAALCVVVSILFVVDVSGMLGIDISGGECDDYGYYWNSTQDFPCFAQAGKQFAIIETWQGGLGLTSSIAFCVQQAYASGIEYVSLYAYACPNCEGNNPPYTAMYNLVKSLAEQGVNYTYLYFDIEEC